MKKADKVVMLRRWANGIKDMFAEHDWGTEHDFRVLEVAIKASFVMANIDRLADALAMEAEAGRIERALNSVEGGTTCVFCHSESLESPAKLPEALRHVPICMSCAATIGRESAHA